MRRRDFVSFAAAAATASAAFPTRSVGKVETVFKSPGPHPNGLQATDDGLWIIDQGPGSHAYLVTYEDGKVLRSFPTETDRSSGVTYDGMALWIGSTYNRQIVRVHAMTGSTLAKHFTPGAGVIYKMVGDPPARSSPLAKNNPRPRETPPPKPGANASAKTAPNPSTVGGFQAGAVLDAIAPGTGAHGQEWRDGFLWMAVPPSREVYKIDPKTWTVHKKFATAANRPHGIGWEGRYLWVTDSNLNAFFKHDPETGEMVEKIQLADSDPLPHGMTIRNGYMWYCDDVGVVCRFKM